MPEEKRNNEVQPGDLARREFVALSVAGLAAAGSAAAADLPVVEKDVTIKTPDGVCDAAYFHPAGGTHPGVLIWTDAFGLRPTFRAMGKRLAAQGYSVLVPNPFYRVSKSPQFIDASNINFAAERSKITPLMSSVNAPGAAEKDAVAYIGFLDAQKEVNTAKKIGTQGYCMGGPLIMKTAATLPARVGAAASFHGGGLVNATPESPHLLAPKIKARMYLGIAASDDAQQPDAKDKLREAFAAAKVVAEVEVYTGCAHGWCIPDMPKQANGSATYSMPDAERAWSKLLALYKAAIA
jgi:carboxymethylenebutenolidase